MNKKIFYIAIIAALYVVLCLILAPISFGPLQFRISEILCLLCIEFPWCILSITIGCFISNILLSSLGIVDAIVGSIASLIACILAYQFSKYRIKNLPIISALMIVIINALVIGIELAYLLNNKEMLFITIIQVGISELIVMIIGLIFYEKLIKIIKKVLKRYD